MARKYVELRRNSFRRSILNILSPLECFLWGHVLSKLVNKSKWETLQHLRENVEEASAAIPQEFIDSACQSVQERTELCIQHQGADFKHHLKEIQ